MHFRILDPTGNITALVSDDVAPERQPQVAAEIMRAHPEVEQVGFVRRPDDAEAAGVDMELRMAGGEFCGNASMCAAALHAEGVGLATGEVRLRVSGAAAPVTVSLERAQDGSYKASVLMPAARAVEHRELAFDGLSALVPVVRMEGISHAVIESASPLFALVDERALAERAIRTWCEELGADGLGLMFLEGEGSARTLTPLVYVPGSGTVFWENSCASGSAAVGTYLASAVTLREPGGVLRADADGWLHGTVRMCS